MAELACADDDRHRTLDAKLAEALQKVLKGEPARKVALAAERAALSREMLSGQEFRRHEAASDAAAYSNLEVIKCGTSDNALEPFLTLWDNLLLTFRVPPSQDHLFTAFTNRVRHLPCMAVTMAHLDRIQHGHPDKNYEFIKGACHSVVERIRSDKQLAEVAKVFKSGGADHALVMTDAEKKKAPCFLVRDGKSCTAGAKCAYSHDPKVIAEAKAKAKAKAKGKAKAAPAKKGEKGTGKGKVKGKQICWHFNQPDGCRKGSACTFLHEAPAVAATQSATSSAQPPPTSGGDGKGAAPSAGRSPGQ